MHRIWVCFAGSALAACAAAGAPTLFDEARVFDGQSDLGVTDVLIDEGVIQRVAREIEPDASTRVVDARGHTLLPGFIDAHTHTLTLSQLRSAASLGVTTVLDMFSSPSQVERFREAQREPGGEAYAAIYSAMTLMTVPGGHGTQYGMDIPTVSGVDDVAPFVRDRFEDEGADYLKIVCEDGSAMGITRPTVSVPMLRAAVRAAHGHGKLAVVHITTRRWATRAADADADVLAHIFSDAPLDDAFIDAAIETDLAISPTLAVTASIAATQEWRSVAEDDRLAPYLDESQLAGLVRTFPGDPDPERLERALRTVGALHNRGVTILAGTDPPNPGTAHGASMHHELDLLARAGLTPSEALAAATGEVARVYNLGDRGVIREGARADLLLVEGDPLDDIDATRDIVGVWREGIRLERALAHRSDNARGSAPGLVSAFDDGGADATIGAGWSVSVDGIVGGDSDAAFSIIDGSKGAMRVKGTVTDKAQRPWAGVQFSPGATPFAAADLSGAEGISFRAKGDGRTYAVIVFTRSGGFVPAFALFTPEQDAWSEHAFAWDAFGGSDGSDVTAIIISAGLPPGAFTIDLDDFTIE